MNASELLRLVVVEMGEAIIFVYACVEWPQDGVNCGSLLLSVGAFQGFSLLILDLFVNVSALALNMIRFICVLVARPWLYPSNLVKGE